MATDCFRAQENLNMRKKIRSHARAGGLWIPMGIFVLFGLTSIDSFSQNGCEFRAEPETVRIEIVASNSIFDLESITVPAGAHVIIDFDSQDRIPHNVSVHESKEARKIIFYGRIINGPQTVRHKFTAPENPGTYFFRSPECRQIDFSFQHSLHGRWDRHDTVPIALFRRILPRPAVHLVIYCGLGRRHTMNDSDEQYPNRFKYYHDPVRKKREVRTRLYEYELPFKYPNVEVERVCDGGEPHGMELFNVPPGRMEDYVYSRDDKTGGRGNRYADGIVIAEDEPIIRVEVIGSACTPPGYVTIECEPIDGWRRSDEVAEAMPVRMRIDNLWGMHLRFDQFLETTFKDRTPDRPGPVHMPERWKALGAGGRIFYQEMPLAGMSSAMFSTPPCRQVRVSGGCVCAGWKSDNCPDDSHYSFRIIRITVESRE